MTQMPTFAFSGPAWRLFFRCNLPRNGGIRERRLVDRRRTPRKTPMTIQLNSITSLRILLNRNCGSLQSQFGSRSALGFSRNLMENFRQQTKKKRLLKCERVSQFWDQPEPLQVAGCSSIYRNIISQSLRISQTNAGA